jgi:hypothetical protein
MSNVLVQCGQKHNSKYFKIFHLHNIIQGYMTYSEAYIAPKTTDWQQVIFTTTTQQTSHLKWTYIGHHHESEGYSRIRPIPLKYT